MIVRHIMALLGPQSPVGTLGCGRYHTAALMKGGSFWASGRNDYGQLGNGSTLDASVFTKASGLPENRKVVAFACGVDHTMVILDNGELWGCGSNYTGQLGNVSYADSNVMVRATSVPVGGEIVSVECGEVYTMILLRNGELWGCGHNGQGQLGNGGAGYSISFVKAASAPESGKIVAVFCGNHTMVLLDNGELWGCGSNEYGQLGNGSTDNTGIFTKVEGLLDRVKTASVSLNGHTLILLESGELMGCGRNDYGQLGKGDTANAGTPAKATSVAGGGKVTSVSCGQDHSMILLKSGEICGCGNNYTGQLGIGAPSGQNTSFIKAIATWEGVS